MYVAGRFLKIGNGRRFEFPRERQWLYGLVGDIIGFSASNRYVFCSK